jgi:tRNA threonylcarbamoyladenosine biosynthesis protein TsaE
MILCGEDQMKALGAKLIQSCDSGGVITLRGELGTGKTTIVRGALEACGITSGVRSPTYTLIENYQLPGLAVAHFDLYRLSDAEELEYLGFRDYLNPQTLCLIEWPQRAEELLQYAGLQISLEYHQGCRRLTAIAKNPWGENLLSALNLM